MAPGFAHAMYYSADRRTFIRSEKALLAAYTALSAGAEPMNEVRTRDAAAACPRHWWLTPVFEVVGSITTCRAESEANIASGFDLFRQTIARARVRHLRTCFRARQRAMPLRSRSRASPSAYVQLLGLRRTSAHPARPLVSREALAKIARRRPAFGSVSALDGRRAKPTITPAWTSRRSIRSVALFTIRAKIS